MEIVWSKLAYEPFLEILISVSYTHLIREGAGEPAHPAGTGAGTGKVRLRYTD